jgi:large subunit ribosomal protein L7e
VERKGANENQKQKEKRKVIFKRADEYVREYRNQEKEEVRLKREARKTGDFYVAAQPKVYFVVRLKGYVHFPGNFH